MTTLTRPWPRAAAVALLVVLLGALGTARADFLFLKDGFVLSGKLKRETITHVDPIYREPYQVPQGGWFLDDGPRVLYFSPRWVRIAEKKEPPDEEKVVDKREFSWLNTPPLPPILSILDEGEFDAKWMRTYRFRG